MRINRCFVPFFTMLLTLFLTFWNDATLFAQTKTVKKEAKKKQMTEKSNEADDYSKPDPPKKSKGASKDVEITKMGSNDKSLDYPITRYNVLKFNASDLWIGTLPFSYERVLNKHVSIEVTGGISYQYGYSEDWIEGLVTKSPFAYFILSAMEQRRVGLVWGVSARYYFGKYNSPEGFYAMGGILNRSYRAQEYDFNGKTAYANLNCLDLARCAVGHQMEYGANWTWDVYLGGALRHITYTGPNVGAGVLQLGNTWGIMGGIRVCFTF